MAVPGSVLLLGEYAITEPDAPGVAVAIQPEVRATLEPGGPPGITGRMGTQRFTWTPRHTDSPLFAALVAGCGPPAGSIAVDSSAFAGPHGKLGLGSSAAVAVAVAALLVVPPYADRRAAGRNGEDGPSYAGSAAAGGEQFEPSRRAQTAGVPAGGAATRNAGVTNRFDAGRAARHADLAARVGTGRRAARSHVFAAALAAHRAAQGGRGSGYDVATSVWGGVVRFTGGRAPAAAPCGLRSLPALYLVRGDRPLATAGAVMRYDQWKQREPGAAVRFVERSREVVEQFLAADDAASCCAALAAGGELTRWLGTRIGVAVEPAALRERLDRFRAAGWVAKPVGAGGELGIAAAPMGTPAPPVPYAQPLRPAPGGLRWLARG